MYLGIAYCIWQWCAKEFLKSCCCLSRNNTDFQFFFFNPLALRAPAFYESFAPHWFIPSSNIIISWVGEDKRNSFGITVPKEHLCQRFHNVSINGLDIVSSFLLVVKYIFCRYSCICFTENGKSWIKFQENLHSLFFASVAYYRPDFFLHAVIWYLKYRIWLLTVRHLVGKFWLIHDYKTQRCCHLKIIQSTKATKV